ncbi:conserved hypothetical protein [Ignisphaera aggregans DSM 17230]|uniref:UPF0033 domain-containing protein n=1 Tax=Ignisphaera aggregans (strain DSM 17230 / JCM 13409 / AQ1.S1) TaxID=583356 RepID=E0SQ25_IGNAA|nr:conserved hypothetical protein [Ignisphaera aggregans DSM 17230]
MILDFRGEECPGPLVKTLRKLVNAKKGEEIIVLTDSKECVNVLRESIVPLGLGSFDVKQEDSYYKITIIKLVDKLDEQIDIVKRC